MDNKFLVLDKSKEKIKQLVNFINEVCTSDENDMDVHKMETYAINIRQYGELWGLESEFMDATHDDLEYWLEKKGKKDIVRDSFLFIKYGYNDNAILHMFFNDNSWDEIFDVYDGTLCETGESLKDDIPIEYIIDYFV